jgi:hypothetical protein
MISANYRYFISIFLLVDFHAPFFSQTDPVFQDSLKVGNFEVTSSPSTAQHRVWGGEVNSWVSAS